MFGKSKCLGYPFYSVDTKKKQSINLLAWGIRNPDISSKGLQEAGRGEGGLRRRTDIHGIPGLTFLPDLGAKTPACRCSP